MERMERDFKGVWIPREIWLSDELSLMEKVLFVEIHSLDNERGCFASNGYFAQFFEMSARQICTHISSLKAKGYITITIENHHERCAQAAQGGGARTDQHDGIEECRRGAGDGAARPGQRAI